MAILKFVIASVFMTLASASPDALQRLYGTPNVGSSSSPENVRSGFISAADSSGFALDSSSDSSGSSQAPGSIFTNANPARSSGSPGSLSLSGGAQSGVPLSSSQNVATGLVIDGTLDSVGLDDVTITQEITVDVFKTVTNVIYNSIPITLTEFMKTTAVQPTLQVVSTPVDDNVFVATAPVTRTDSVTVTDTNTGYIYVTEIPTDTYTITHKAYDILQKTLTSTLQQTRVFHPTVVRTRINTEYDTQTVQYIVTNTVFIQQPSTRSFGSNSVDFDVRSTFGNQQVFGQGQDSGRQQVLGQGPQDSGRQQVLGQGPQDSDRQQVFGQGPQDSGRQQVFGQGPQDSGRQQVSEQISGLNDQAQGNARFLNVPQTEVQFTPIQTSLLQQINQRRFDQNLFGVTRSDGGATGQTGRNVDQSFSAEDEQRRRRNQQLLAQQQPRLGFVEASKYN